MMDGISAMDTGNNGQMLQMNIESIAEVKVLTQGYQAEYGRSSGLQITAVTKSGTNRFHGSLYDIDDQLGLEHEQLGEPARTATPRRVSQEHDVRATRSAARSASRAATTSCSSSTATSTGRRRAAASISRFRVPTALERAGDFSQSLDNNGKPIPQLKNPNGGSRSPATSSRPAGCTRTGLAILNRYPLPNLDAGAPDTNYNLEIPRPEDKNLLQQPAVRVDYQFSPALRVTGKFSGQRQTRSACVQGTMPGFNDVLMPYPYISNYGITVNYTFNSTTFLEATYGSIKNELAGGGSGGILVNDSANRLNSLPDFPLIYPDAGVVDPRYYQLDALTRTEPALVRRHAA